MTKKPSHKNKTWEKDRRDRLNIALGKLAELLPLYDPSIVWTKNEIIQQSITYIQQLQSLHREYLQSHDPKLLGCYDELMKYLNLFQTRHKLLYQLLENAKIAIPPPISLANLSVQNKHCEANNLTDQETSTKDSKKLFAGNLAQNADAQKTIPSVNLQNCSIAEDVRNIVATRSSAVKVISTGMLLPIMTCKVTSIPSSGEISKQKKTSDQNPNFLKSCRQLLGVHKIYRNFKYAKDKGGKIVLLPRPANKINFPRNDKVAIPRVHKKAVAVKKRKKNKASTKMSSLLNKSCAKLLEKSMEYEITGHTDVKADTNISTEISSTSQANIACNIERSYPAGALKNLTIATKPVLDRNNPCSLQKLQYGPYAESLSPTAAFLMSFPVVSSSSGTKLYDTPHESVFEPEKKETSTSVTDSLENLNTFFTTKEYNKYCEAAAISKEIKTRHTSTNLTKLSSPSYSKPNLNTEFDNKVMHETKKDEEMNGFTFCLTSTTNTSAMNSTPLSSAMANTNTTNCPWQSIYEEASSRAAFTFSLTPTTATTCLSKSQASNLDTNLVTMVDVASNLNSGSELLLNSIDKSDANLSLSHLRRNDLCNDERYIPPINFRSELQNTNELCESNKLLNNNGHFITHQSYRNALCENACNDRESVNFTFTLTQTTNSSVISQNSGGISDPRSEYNQRSQRCFQGRLINDDPKLAEKNFCMDNTANKVPPFISKPPVIASKSHVNWMTAPFLESEPFLPSHPQNFESSLDFTYRNPEKSLEDNLPFWPTPSPKHNTQFNNTPTSKPPTNYDIAYATPSDLIFTQEAQKKHFMYQPYSMPISDSKKKKNYYGPPSSNFSVTQLVEQATHNKKGLCHSKKQGAAIAIDQLREIGIQSSCLQSSANNCNDEKSCKSANFSNPYSAEALISKKEKHKNNSHTSHSLNFSQNLDATLSSSDRSYSPQSVHRNSSSSFSYNYAPVQHCTIQETDHLSSQLSGRDQRSLQNRVSLSACHSYAYGSNYHTVSVPSTTVSATSSVLAPPATTSYESADCGQSQTYAGWISKVNLPTHRSVVSRIRDQNLTSSMQCCSSFQNVQTSSGNLTNFNLRSICPEINEEIKNSISSW